MSFILTPELNEISKNKNKIVIIEGGKDTGKSTAGLLRTIKLSKNNQKVLFLTFTKQSAITLNKKINLIFNNSRENIKIINIDKFFINFYLKNIGEINKKIIRTNGKIVKDFVNTKIEENDNISEEEIIIQISKIIDEDYKNIDDYLICEKNITDVNKKKIWFILKELKKEMKKNEYVFLLDLYKQIINNKKIEFNNCINIKKEEFVFNHMIVDNIEDLGQTRYNLLKQIFKNLFNKNKSTITFIGDLNTEVFLYSTKIKNKIDKIKINKNCKTFKLEKVMRNTNISVAEDLAKKYNFSEDYIERYNKIKVNEIYPCFIENISLDKEYENIAKIISFLKQIGYSYEEINIITFANTSLEVLNEVFNEEFNIPIYCNISSLSYGEYDLFEYQKKIKKRIETLSDYEEGIVKCMTAHSAQKSLENKVIILFDTITLDNINSEDASEEMKKKRIMLLYETLYTSSELLFIFGNNDNFSSINELNKEYMECVENINDISLFYGIEDDYDYLKETTFNDYIKECFNNNFNNFEKYCSKKEKQTFIFDYYELKEEGDNYYNDYDIALTIKEAQRKIEEKHKERYDSYLFEYYNRDYSIDDYINEAFDGDEETWEDYCEDIAERYDD